MPDHASGTPKHAASLFTENDALLFTDYIISCIVICFNLDLPQSATLIANPIENLCCEFR